MIETKYQKLSEDLETYITENHITGRLPGVLRLSKELGVHHLTLMKAIRLLEKKGVLSVQGTRGTFVNTFSPSPSRQKYHVIAVVRGYYNSMDQQSLIRQLNQIARPQGYEIIGLTLDRELFRQNPNVLLNFPVDGFLFTYSSLQNKQAELLRMNNIPVVSCAKMNGLPWLNQGDCDHQAGYNMMLDQLLKRGHSRIGFLEYDRESDYQHYLAQIRTIFQARLGKQYDPACMFTRCLVEDLQNEYGVDAAPEVYAKKAVHHWLSLPHSPTAVITASNMYHSVLLQLQKYGIRVPQDMSVLSVSHFSTHPPETVSGVFYDEMKITCHCMQTLLQILSGENKAPEIYLEQPEFLLGDTLAEVPHKGKINAMKKKTTTQKGT